MSIECELEIGGYGEQIDGYEVATSTVQSPEECMECQREITPGSHAEIVTGEFEGEAIRWVTCSDCAEIAEAFSDGMRIHGTLWSELEEGSQFENFTSGCMEKLASASAKQYLVERWRKWKGV